MSGDHNQNQGKGGGQSALDLQSTDARLQELESIAKRLALDLECVLLNPTGWWDQAHETLQAYSDLMDAWYPQEYVSPMGID